MASPAPTAADFFATLPKPTYETACADLEFALCNGLSPMLEGPPGVGKTDMVELVAARIGRGLVTDTLSTQESVDLRGLPMNSPDGLSVRWSRPEFLERLWNAGPEPIIFWDEANAVSQSLQVPLMQMTLAGVVGPHKLPKGTSVVLAGNRVSDRAAAQRQGTALASRLQYIPVEPDLKSWLKWAAKADVCPEIRAFLMLRGEDVGGRPGLLCNFNPARPEERSFACPRSWAQASPIVAKASEAQRLRMLRHKIGDAAAMEIEGFLRVFKTLPPIPAILADPLSCAVPSEPSAQYAVACALSRAARPDSFGAILTYMGRIGAEFQTVTATDAVRRNSELAHTTAYIDWASLHADVAI